MTDTKVEEATDTEEVRITITEALLLTSGATAQGREPLWAQPGLLTEIQTWCSLLC
jgi:hypothetical protein